MLPNIIHGNCDEVLPTFADGYFDLIYIDPPYNTGKIQRRGELQYSDKFDNFKDFIYPKLKEAYRVLSQTGSILVHLDYREVHYVKVWMDEIFGRKNFMNEIIWSYDYGGRSKTKWSAKHDNILWYVKDNKNYTFNYSQIKRIPYLSPIRVGVEKAAKGKTQTDVIWHTIVPTQGKEKTGYPTQKPVGLLSQLVSVHSNSKDRLLDFFAGSGSLAAAAEDRECWLVDQNKDAIEIMKKRFK